jgi:hypothetical protein
MNKCTLLLAAIVLSPCLLCAQSSIEGNVINRVTRDGVASAEVRVYSGRDLRYQVSTSADGSFLVSQVPDGSYTVTASAEGFGRPMLGGPPPLAVVSGPHAARATLELEPMVVVRGLVLDPDGKPASGAQLELFCSPIVFSAVSYSNGHFEFRPVPPGKCQLSARPARTKKPAIEGDRLEPVITFYPSALEPGGEDLNITGITSEQEIEIRLRSTRVYRLSGVVKDEAGTPMKGARVQLIRSGVEVIPTLAIPAGPAPTSFGVPLSLSPELQRPRDVSTSGEDGKFDFPSVPEGEWVVRAIWHKEGDSPGVNEPLGEADVSVSRFDVESLEIRLASSFTLWATVEWPDGFPVPKQPMMFAGMRPIKMGRIVSGILEHDGRIYFDDLYPASYTVRIALLDLPDAYVSAILVSGKNVIDQEVQLSASSGPIRIVIKTGTGSVRGTVENGASAFVLLAPANLSEASSVRVVRSTAGQPFDFPNVVPGEYLVGAFDQDPSEALRDQARRAGLPQLTKRITVDQRGRIQMELPLESWK